MEFSDEDISKIVQAAYGPDIEDGELLTGKQMRQFAQRAIERLLGPLCPSMDDTDET